MLDEGEAVTLAVTPDSAQGSTPGRSEQQLASLRSRQLLFAWSGPVFVVLLAIGMIPLMGFLPAPSPNASPGKIAALYLSNLTSIRVGIAVCTVAVALLATWGAGIAARTRRTEGSFPAFTYAQLACTAVATMIAVLIYVVWAVAAFRPAAVSTETTRVLNDTGWFLFLFDTPPFMVWCVVIGLPILMNRSGQALFPRWAGHFSLWVALLQSPPLLIVFFKNGPVAYNGMLALWVPLVSFLVFVLVMSGLLIKAVNRDDRAVINDEVRGTPA